MDERSVLAIKNNPSYQVLVRKRGRLGWLLSILMVLIYFGFVLVIAFEPALFAVKLGDGSVISIGIPIGIGVIIAAFVLTGFYVYRANGEFDELTAKIKTELEAK